MRPRRSHTGYGVWDITRQVARRVQQEWENIESPRRPPQLLAPPESSPFPTPAGGSAKSERRPLAA